MRVECDKQKGDRCVQPTIDEVRVFLQGEYHRISADWYQGVDGYNPAHLEIELRHGSGGYSFEKNVLALSIDEGNLGDFAALLRGEAPDVNRGIGWIANYSELI